MVKHGCVKCGRHSVKETGLSAKDTIRSITLIYVLPLALFIIGISAGLVFFKSYEAGYFYCVILAFGGMLLGYAVSSIFERKE